MVDDDLKRIERIADEMDGQDRYYRFSRWLVEWLHGGERFVIVSRLRWDSLQSALYRIAGRRSQDNE